MFGRLLDDFPKQVSFASQYITGKVCRFGLKQRLNGPQKSYHPMSFLPLTTVQHHDASTTSKGKRSHPTTALHRNGYVWKEVAKEPQAFWPIISTQYTPGLSCQQML